MVGNIIAIVCLIICCSSMHVHRSLINYHPPPFFLFFTMKIRSIIHMHSYKIKKFYYYYDQTGNRGDDAVRSIALSIRN